MKESIERLPVQLLLLLLFPKIYNGIARGALQYGQSTFVVRGVIYVLYGITHPAKYGNITRK
jgi:hypothetical protein